MHLALIGLFRAKWSADVHEEWISNLLKNRPDLTREKLERTRMLMDKHAVYNSPIQTTGTCWRLLFAAVQMSSLR
jgi:hypothetical protein